MFTSPNYVHLICETTISYLETVGGGVHTVEVHVYFKHHFVHPTAIFSNSTTLVFHCNPRIRITNQLKVIAFA